LNFGHTLGHALENHELSHGQAVAIGMTYALLFLKRQRASMKLRGLRILFQDMICQHLPTLISRKRLRF
jgi:3-dehydroquinate synthetase